jgi:hypothetical protein
MPGVPRAQRFQIETQISWRPKGEGPWSDGRTLNVSRTGVLFHVDEPLPAGTPVEMVLFLSSAIFERSAADVLCSGRVVRTEAQTPTGYGPSLAATIDSYSFSREQETS